jgi:hypothetical protein
LSGATLLILGQDKGAEIDNVALLVWYREQFRELLCQPDARLMIIGYGFGDAHINEIICDGASRGAKLFLIGPDGVEVLYSAPPLPGRAWGLAEAVEESIIGASRRPFLSIFGSDRVELDKISRFFV